MKRIAVIGIGTLGGAICKNISEMEAIDEIVIIDYDILESKNIHNSVYSATQIGDFKVDALTELIENNINVIPIKEKYIEGKTILPKCDLIIDCRDFVYNRGNEIDVRLYITEKILIIDCRKNTKSQYNYKGTYRVQLSKSELNKAGFFASQIICSNQIKNMVKNKSIQRLDLNLLPVIINNAIKKSISDQVDIVYDTNNESNRLHCLEENIDPILTLSKTKNIDIFIGEKNSGNLSLLKSCTDLQRMPKVAKTKYAVIPRNSLKNSSDLIQALSLIVKEQNNLVNFIVTLRKENGQTFVELLEETGAA